MRSDARETVSSVAGRFLQGQAQGFGDVDNGRGLAPELDPASFNSTEAGLMG